MKALFYLFLFLLSSLAYSADYKVSTEQSKTSWHLYIDKGTDIYGDIPVIEGQFRTSEIGITGSLSFNLKETKSYELNGKEKELSNGRDKRIYGLTSAKRKTPVFVIKTISGYNVKKASNKVKITGDLSLNGETKTITIEGSLSFVENKMVLEAKYKLFWEKFDIGNPVLWIMRAAKTADPFISLTFKIVATK